MATLYPKEMKLFATAPGVKKTFVSDVQMVNPRDCSNCGGAGRMTLFCAMEGPHQSPGAPYKTVVGYNDEGKQVERSMTNHFDSEINAWWIGNMYSFACPVCAGYGRKRCGPPLVHPHTGEVLE